MVVVLSHHPARILLGDSRLSTCYPPAGLRAGSRSGTRSSDATTHPMLRTFLILSLSFFATVLCAQLPDPLAELAGSTTRQWRVIGARSAVISECVPGEAWYIFQLKPAQVVVKQCEAGAMKARTEVITTWSANGKSGIAFGGARYEVKAIPATAPACQGNSNCVRLATVPDGRTDATRSIYLTY